MLLIASEKPFGPSRRQTGYPEYRDTFISVSTFRQSLVSSLSASHMPSNSFWPSILMPKARNSALFITRPWWRTFIAIRSMQTMGHSGSSGYHCHLYTYSLTALVTLDISVGNASACEHLSESRDNFICRRTFDIQGQNLAVHLRDTRMVFLIGCG